MEFWRWTVTFRPHWRHIFPHNRLIPCWWMVQASVCGCRFSSNINSPPKRPNKMKKKKKKTKPLWRTSSCRSERDGRFVCVKRKFEMNETDILEFVRFNKTVRISNSRGIVARELAESGARIRRTWRGRSRYSGVGHYYDMIYHFRWMLITGTRTGGVKNTCWRSIISVGIAFSHHSAFDVMLDRLSVYG